ncbi:GUN4 domain-containing protein [Nostoc commune]|uniref:GUN4 domain-containing protein n=1 Tax=Nostoc commune TaxID=1178 RepID=UPI0018C79849|nr:GUN4 domain-containing protein [Nostoc commune]MBG1261364.1 NACHT domain-containing protein [Nostoc commune BAE]
MEVSDIKGKVDFAIITILEDEFKAVLARFPGKETVKGKRFYNIRYVEYSESEDYLVVVTRSTEQGTNEAQNLARDIIEDLNPHWLLLVGIAGGVPEDEFTLGDVVVATRLNDFSVSAAIESNKDEFSSRGGPMHPEIRIFLANLPAWEQELQGWSDEESIGMPYPTVELQEENFYGSESWQKKVKERLEKHFGSLGKPHPPKVITGAVASSDTLVKDTKLVEQWKQSARHLLAVEMELTGVYIAARQIEREYPILAIRGISDIVGFRRDPGWTTYACNSAAAFAFAFIRRIKPFEPRKKKAINQELLQTYNREIPSEQLPDTPLEPSTQQQKILILGAISEKFFLPPSMLKWLLSYSIQILKSLLKKNFGENKDWVMSFLAYQFLNTYYMFRLNLEILEIEQAIRQADKQNFFDIKVKTSENHLNIYRAIQEERPQIVHICGQSNRDGSLVLKEKDDQGNNKFLSPEDLEKLFNEYSSYVNCVILNSSHSSNAAKLISRHINYAIGMKQPIIDQQAVITFIQDFYESFFDGLKYKTNDNQDFIETAFDKGFLALNFIGSSPLLIPVLKTRTETEYYQWLINEYQGYQTEGLSKDCALELPKVFVPLKIVATRQDKAHSELIWQASNEENDLKNPQIWNFLAKKDNNSTYRSMVILGGPGAGKSTLLRYLTLIYASEEQQEYEANAPELIPVLLLIRKVYQKIINNNKVSLVDLVTEQINQATKENKRIPSLSRWLVKKLNQIQNNKCLIMLDGLDEVADESQRQEIRDWVDKQIHAYNSATFIVTSRPRSYKAASLNKVGIVLEVQQFNMKQIQDFIHNWYTETEINTRPEYEDESELRKDADKKADDLILRIKNSSSLRVMAVNPLLLTMIARVHHQRTGSLPERRVELYKEICEVLLEKRQKEKNIHDMLTAEDKQSLLQTLALHFMKKEKNEIQLSEAISEIKKTAARRKIDPKKFIEHIRDVSALLMEKELTYYQFAHLSFQEYLAAVEIKELNLESLLINNIDKSWWTETIRLYAAQSDASNLIRSVLKMSSPSLDVWAVTYDCLEESLKVDVDVRQELIQRLEEGLESNDEDTFKLAVQVRLIRRLRNFIGINKKLEIDNIYITCAEYQLFIDETGETGNSPYLQSNRFPVGDAKKNMTGISWENANRFCVWLKSWEKNRESTSQPNDSSFYYRLMTQEEASNYGFNIQPSEGICLVREQLPSKYTGLADHLLSGNWQKANTATIHIILQIASKPKQNSLFKEDIEKFPDEELCTIDKLWVYASKGRFGFSVQHQIFKRLDDNRTFGMEILKIFGKSVGWYVEENWLFYPRYFTFDLTAEQGCFPYLLHHCQGATFFSHRNF